MGPKVRGPAEYKPPSQREQIKSDAEMMANDIINRDPRVAAAKKKLASQLERDALDRVRKRPKI